MSEDANNKAKAEEIVALCLPLEYIGSSHHYALTKRIAAALREKDEAARLHYNVAAERLRAWEHRANCDDWWPGNNKCDSDEPECVAANAILAQAEEKKNG